MRARFEEVIEAATGREVIGFMRGNQQEPDMMCEVFILAPPIWLLEGWRWRTAGATLWGEGITEVGSRAGSTN